MFVQDVKAGESASELRIRTNAAGIVVAMQVEKVLATKDNSVKVKSLADAEKSFIKIILQEYPNPDTNKNLIDGNITTLVMEEANKIALSTRRSAANIIICNPSAKDLFNDADLASKNFMIKVSYSRLVPKDTLIFMFKEETCGPAYFFEDTKRLFLLATGNNVVGDWKNYINVVKFNTKGN